MTFAELKQRKKIVMVDEQHVLDLLISKGNWLKVPVVESSHIDDVLPDGYQVLSVLPDWHRGVFKFLVVHESFDLVPDGCVPENIMCKFVFEDSEEGENRK